MTGDQFGRGASERSRSTPQGREALLREGFIWALHAAQALRDPDTAGHAQRLSFYAARTARILGCGEEEQALVRLAALVHDIGKIGIPDTVLFKPEALSAEELSVMTTHPMLGRRVLLNAGEGFIPLAEIVEAHHERCCGTRYDPRVVAAFLRVVAELEQAGIALSLDSYAALNESAHKRPG